MFDLAHGSDLAHASGRGSLSRKAPMLRIIMFGITPLAGMLALALVVRFCVWLED